MPSINLKNNELDFTPTFGTQQSKVEEDQEMLDNAAYFVTISHMSRWTNAQINSMIIQIYHENKSNLREFFSLSENDWKNFYNIDEKKLAALIEAKE